MLNDKELFRLVTFEGGSSPVNATFDKLENDPYLKSDFVFRKRRFSKGRFSKNGIEWLPHEKFFQSSEINDYAGGVTREFPPLCDVFRSFIVTVLMNDEHLKMVSENAYEIGVHQIRIACENNNPGFPTPEGAHQDGFDFVGLYCFNIENATGGESRLLFGKKDGECVFQNVLKVGHGLVINDKFVFHVASPIIPLNNGSGYRDICVVTYEAISDNKC